MQCYEATTNNPEIKKGAGGVVGQTKHEAFVTEWELCYHEVLAINIMYHAEITGSVLACSDAEPLHRELRKTSILEYNDAASKVVAFINERGTLTSLQHVQHCIISPLGNLSHLMSQSSC